MKRCSLLNDFVDLHSCKMATAPAVFQLSPACTSPWVLLQDMTTASTAGLLPGSGRNGAAPAAAFAAPDKGTPGPLSPIGALAGGSVQPKSLLLVFVDYCLCYCKSCLIHIRTHTFTGGLMGDEAQHNSFSSNLLSSS